MKNIGAAVLIILGLAVVGLLTFGAVKATAELSRVIAEGISNIYAVGE